MLRNKTYLKILFTLLGTIIAIAIGYAIYFSKNYPLPITNRISFDAKIKFIRENIDIDTVDTIIVGSSIGLNNIQGYYLEKASKKCNSVLNFSIYESSAFQIEQLLKLMGAFPNLKRIIYSAQFSDFQPQARYKNYDPIFLSQYMRDELSQIEYLTLLFNSCKNIFFCINRQREWQKKHSMNNKFTYLEFDSTGSVPLHIYGKDIIERRWAHPHGHLQVPSTFKAVDRISKKLYDHGIQLYFVQQPYRYPLTIGKYQYVDDVINSFGKRITKIITNRNGHFLSLHKELHLKDKYFADRSHLNDQGSILSAKAIAKFIDECETH